MNEKLQSIVSIRFKLIYLSTGEVALDQLLFAAGKRSRGGQEVRMLEILAETSQGDMHFAGGGPHPTVTTDASGMGSPAYIAAGRKIGTGVPH